MRIKRPWYLVAPNLQIIPASCTLLPKRKIGKSKRLESEERS